MKDNKLKLKIEKLRLELMIDIVEHKIFKEQNSNDGSLKKACKYDCFLKKLVRQYRQIKKRN